MCAPWHFSQSEGSTATFSQSASGLWRILTEPISFNQGLIDISRRLVGRRERYI
jgi:hypothetical protein